MNFPDVSLVTNAIKTTAIKRCPEILTGIGLAGMITATVLAVCATPKAVRLLDEKKKALNADKLPVTETVKATWKCYIPTAVTMVLSSACIIGANSVHVKRYAALGAAYALSESTFKEYRDKVVETVGDKKEQKVHDEIAKEKIEKQPVSSSEVIVTGKGETLCYDSISGRYFKSDMEKLRQAQNELNRRMISEMNISLNDFYAEIGLNEISIGDNIGWDINKGLIELGFSSQLADDGTPCLVVDFRNPPTYEYYPF